MSENEEQQKPKLYVNINTVRRIEDSSRHIGCDVKFNTDPDAHLYNLYLSLPEIDRRIDQRMHFRVIIDSFSCFIVNSRNAAYYKKTCTFGNPSARRRRRRATHSSLSDFSDAASGPPTMYEVLAFFESEWKGFSECLDLPNSEKIGEQTDSYIFTEGNEALEDILSYITIPGVDDGAIEQRIRTAWLYYLDRQKENRKNALLLAACETADKRFSSFCERHKDKILGSERIEYSHRRNFYFSAEPDLLEELEDLGLVDTQDEDFIHAKLGNLPEYDHNAKRIYPEIPVSR